MPPLFELIASGNVQVDQVLIELHDSKQDNFTSQLNEFFSAGIKPNFELSTKNVISGVVMVLDVLSMHL